jgi:hypothetical protein
MPGPHTFLGSIDQNFNTPGNWDTNLVPQTDDDFMLNHRAEKPLIAGMDQSGKDFGRVTVSEGYNQKFADAATPFIFGTLSDLYFAGRGLGAWLAGTVTRAHVSAPNASLTTLVLDCAVTDLVVRSGIVQLTGSKAMAGGGRIHVGAVGSGEDFYEAAQLIVADTFNLTTAALALSGGRVQCSANVGGRIDVSGGEFLAEDSAAVTLLQMLGGKFRWRGDGTITAAHIAGDALFDATEFDLVKTLTDLDMYDDAVVDLSAGYNLTVSNGIRVHGKNAPRMPQGTVYSFA